MFDFIRFFTVSIFVYPTEINVFYGVNNETLINVNFPIGYDKNGVFEKWLVIQFSFS